MAHFVDDSKVVQSTCNKNYHIFESEFRASKSFFDNATYFHSTDSVLDFDPNTGNSLVFLLFFRSKFFPFRFLLGMHTSIPFGLCP